MSDEPEVVEGEVVDETTTVTALAIDELTRAEIDMQISTAKRYPRSLAQVKRNMIEMATIDEETAESCFYSLKRRDADGTNKIIQGPSVRLAEIALSCFGNIRAGTRSLGETEDGRFVRELGICHDVQNNVMVAREVKRRITRRDGKRYGDDMVGTTMAAAGSIALRNAVLTVVPRALVKPAYEKAREVATGKTKSLTVRRNEVVARLQKLSPLIGLDRILAAVEKPSLEEVGWPEVEHLIGLGTAVKDGLQSVEEAFPVPTAQENGSRAESLLSRLQQQEAAPVQATDDLQAPPPQPPPHEAGVLTREELVEEIRALLKRHGKTGPARDEALQGAFGDPSWIRVCKLDAEDLAVGLRALQANLDGLAAMAAERQPGED